MPRGPIEVKVVSSGRTFAERVSAYVPIFISVLALSVAIYGSYQTRRHNRLSVKPFVHFNTFGAQGDPMIGLVIENTGLGPAVISDFTIFLDKEKLSNVKSEEWKHVSQTLSELFHGQTPTYHWIGNGYVLKAGESLSIYTISPDHVSDIDQFNRLFLGRLVVRVRVCSVYNECHNVCSYPSSDCEKE